MSAEYTPWAVQLSLASNSPVVPVTDLSNPPNISTVTDESGATTVQSRSVSGVAPQINITTKAIDRVLSVVPQSGICINSSGTLRGVSAYYKRLVTCQDQTVGASDHALRQMLAGGLFPQTLSAGRGESLRLTLECNGIKDASNGSLAINNAVSLPTIAAADKYEFILGAMRIGGLVTSDVTNFNLNFGIQQVDRRPALGSLEPETTGTRRVDPSIEVSGLDLRNFGTGAVTLSGLAATHANTEFWFKRRKSGGGLEADGSAVHAKLSMSGMAICTEGGSGSGGSSSTTSFRIESIDDGTNAPLIFTWNTTYSPGF